MKIVIIDDELVDLIISQKILETDFQVEGFSNLADAVQWAKHNPFDVLLSDFYLGTGMHANEVIKALTEVRGKTFKAFVVTNYIDGKKAAQLIQDGFSGIIDKPLELGKVKKALGL
jgi:DNA-binding NtrC family response regulator